MKLAAWYSLAQRMVTVGGLEVTRSLGQSQGNEGKLIPSLKTRPDLFEAVTEQILTWLEQGVVAWQSPSVARVGLPRNFSTGKAYRGINVFLLGVHEFQSPFFLTFLQAKELGGHVRRGEQGMPIVKMGTLKSRGGDEEETQDPSEKTRPRRFLRLYTVFNACQIDGIEFPPHATAENFTESAMAKNAAMIVAGMPNPPTIHEGRKAYPHYMPTEDTVEMPDRRTFRAEWSARS